MLLLDLSLALPRALFWSWGWWQKQAAFHIQFCVRHAVLWLFKSLRGTVTCLMNGGWRLRSDVALPSLMKRVLDHGPVNRGWLIFTLLKFWQNNLSKLYHTCLVYSWSLMEHLCGPLWVCPFLVFSLKGSKSQRHLLWQVYTAIPPACLCDEVTVSASSQCFWSTLSHQCDFLFLAGKITLEEATK